MPLSEKLISLDLRLLTVAEYHQMVTAGILQPDEKLELIAGQIIRQMSPQRSSHAAAIRRADRLLSQRLGEQVMIQKQLPVILNNWSEPEPDLAVVKLDPLDYEEGHPKVEDVYWIIEVADSTLRRDLEVKAFEYGRSQIEEYWVLDLNHRQLYVYREPGNAGYQQQSIFGEEEDVSPVQFPGCRIQVKELLRSQNP